MEVGVLLFPEPRRAAAVAQVIEGLGFDGLLFPDSQNLLPEVWGQLVLAAKATTRLRLGPGVTNSVTRDAAVTASAALSLQVESDGRALVGIGRGDSAVQRIGRREDPVAAFERHLVLLQAYLAGETVDRDGQPSRLEWHARAGVAKPPVMVAATGPRVIAAAARRADAVCFAVGADPDHIASVLERAREAARAGGRDPRALRHGAFVNCVVHDDPAVARDGVRGSAATFARFSALPGSPLAALPPPLAAAARWLREHYDMREHTRTGVAHTAGIGDDFVDWFAVAGPASVARERLEALRALGLDFVWLIPGSSNMPRDVAAASLATLARDVVPLLR
jgi:5,10-methylenetetrahydromethanopterin reductase